MVNYPYKYPTNKCNLLIYKCFLLVMAMLCIWPETFAFIYKVFNLTSA